MVAGNDGIVKLLSATDEFVVRNRRIRGEGKDYGGQKSNEREFHVKGMKKETLETAEGEGRIKSEINKRGTLGS